MAKHDSPPSPRVNIIIRVSLSLSQRKKKRNTPHCAQNISVRRAGKVTALQKDDTTCHRSPPKSSALQCSTAALKGWSWIHVARNRSRQVTADNSVSKACSRGSSCCHLGHVSHQVNDVLNTGPASESALYNPSMF